MNVNLKVVAFLLSLAACVFALVLGVAVGSEEYLAPSLVIIAFAGLFVLANPAVAVVGAIATFSSGLTVPGLPGQMKLFDVFALSLIAIFLLGVVMKSGRQKPFSRLEWVVLAFSGWIFFIGSVRGFGFLAFGGDLIGGFNYLRLFLAASLIITMPRVAMPEGAWKPTFLLMGLLAPATLIADILITRGWAFGIVRLFVQTSGEIGDMMSSSGDNGESLQRLWSAGPAATGMLLALLCLVPMRRFFAATGIIWLGLFAGIVVLSLLSGFRLMTASLLVVAALTLFFQKGFTASRMVVLTVAGTVGLICVYLFSDQLPTSVQRTISWLPGIQVSGVALMDATATVDWRLRLWTEALRYFSDYWLVGKGFSYSKMEFLAAFASNDDLRWAIVNGSYHNGWLSMILCTGIIGTVLCLILLIGPVRRHWKRQFAPWRNETYKRFHGVFLAVLVSTAGIFVVLYGDVHVSFPVLFFHWAVLETLVVADRDAPRHSSERGFESGADSEDSLYRDA